METKIKVRFRKAVPEDLDGIYECHKLCFEDGDLWYKAILQQSLEDGYVMELIDSNKIIGVLLQGDVKACEMSELEGFVSLNDLGDKFKKNNLLMDEFFGITMLCVDPNFRGKGLAKKMIDFHLKNSDDISCIHTRKSNPAYNLYVKMGYTHIANVTKKYFNPDEDSCLLIYNSK